jgi:uncharacterized protein DUF6624
MRLTNPALRDELLSMQRADLELRARLVADGSLFDGYAEPMAELHRGHNARFRAILAEHGWPGPSLVGDDGAAAAALVLQHAILDPELMRGAETLLRRAVDAGEAEPKAWARLVDRIRSLEARPQLYGTQYDWDEAGNLSPLPIEDAQRVDERRRSVGLDTLEQNTERLRAQAARENESAPADLERRKRAAEEWARSVGWR